MHGNHLIFFLCFFQSERSVDEAASYKVNVDILLRIRLIILHLIFCAQLKLNVSKFYLLMRSVTIYCAKDCAKDANSVNTLFKGTKLCFGVYY